VDGDGIAAAARWHGHDGLLHGAKICAAVSGDKKVCLREKLAGGKRQETERDAKKGSHFIAVGKNVNKQQEM
jgi:hypothetical protein